MSNNGCWFISTSTIGALHGHLRTAWFLHCCAPSSADSVHFTGSLDQSYLLVGFKARLDHATGMDWVSARGPFSQFWVIATLSIWLSIISSGKIRKHVQDFFSSTVSAFQSLCLDRFWQQVLWSEVRTLGFMGAPLGQAFWEPLGSHPANTKTMHMRSLYNPKWLRKTTTPFNFTIKSRYRFK